MTFYVTTGSGGNVRTTSKKPRGVSRAYELRTSSPHRRLWLKQCWKVVAGSNVGPLLYQLSSPRLVQLLVRHAFSAPRKLTVPVLAGLTNWVLVPWPSQETLKTNGKRWERWLGKGGGRKPDMEAQRHSSPLHSTGLCSPHPFVAASFAHQSA